MGIDERIERKLVACAKTGRGYRWRTLRRRCGHVVRDFEEERHRFLQKLACSLLRSGALRRWHQPEAWRRLRALSQPRLLLLFTAALLPELPPHEVARQLPRSVLFHGPMGGPGRGQARCWLLRFEQGAGQGLAVSYFVQTRASARGEGHACGCEVAPKPIVVDEAVAALFDCALDLAPLQAVRLPLALPVPAVVASAR